MRPIWSDLEHTLDATRLWERSQQRFFSNVLGPHFEHICRFWTRHFAPPELFSHPNRVGAGTVNDPANKTSHQLDVVAFGLTDDGRTPLTCIGEAKWGETMGMSHLQRLRRIRALLAAQDRDGAATATLVCYSGAGFSAELIEHADREGDVVLIGLADLYRDR